MLTYRLLPWKQYRDQVKRSRLSVELQWRDYYIRMGLRVSPPYRGPDAEAAYHAMRYEQLAFID